MRPDSLKVAVTRRLETLETSIATIETFAAGHGCVRVGIEICIVTRRSPRNERAIRGQGNQPRSVVFRRDEDAVAPQHWRWDIKVTIEFARD